MVWCYQGGVTVLEKRIKVEVAAPIVLRLCYAMSGTDIAYAPMYAPSDVRYSRGLCSYATHTTGAHCGARPCPVLR
eukprot:1733843-Rhodomonas_salina.4